MNRCYLDSNLLIYFKNASSPYHKKASEILEKLVQDEVRLYISPLVLDEFLHGFGRELKRSKSRKIYMYLKKALDDVLEIPSIKLVNASEELETQKLVVKFMEKFMLGSRDAYHLLIMLQERINGFATFDNDFKKVFSGKVLERVI